MKNLKRLTALGLAATMVVGSGVTAFAGESEGTDTGEGKYEGYVDETSVFSVDVPTAAANVFDFFVDPNGLLEATGYARLSAQATDFEDGATLFFNRDGEAGVDKKYGKTSKKITAKNMSSYDVNIEISAAVSGADGIEFAETDEVSSAEAPTLYLALTDGAGTTKPISADGGLLTGTIEGYADNFEIKYDGGEYKYALKDGILDSDSNWKTYSFQLTGACGGTWTDEQSEAAPTVALTWKVTDPKAEAAPSIKTASYTMKAGQDLSVNVNLGAGELAATGISKITYQKNGAATTLDASKYTFSGNVLKFNAAYIDSVLNASVSSREYTVIFNDAAKTQVKITLNAE